MARLTKKALHKEIITDYDSIKNKHLEHLATKLLEKNDKLEKLKSKIISKDILNLF